MANRKSWRRAAGPPSNRGPSRPANKSASPFAGISSATLSSVLHLLLAKDVNLTTVDGAVHKGLFAATEHAPDGLRIVLNYARSRPPKEGKPLGTFVEKRGDVARKFSVCVKHVVSVTAASPMNVIKMAPVPASRKAGFAIDGDITKGNTGAGRQLEPFNDFTELVGGVGGRPATLDEHTFGDLANGRPGKKWDQFQVNEDKFGVTTSFDEHQYTTKIDTRDARFAEREKEAAKLALEIEGKQADNVHLRIERNQGIDADFDEETLHSGVDRAAMKEPPKPAGKPAAKGKATPVERPRLSYAAAAAGSVKAQVPQTVNKPAPPVGKPAHRSSSTSSRSTGPSAPATTPSADTKERDPVMEKKPKSNSMRSSRDNLPQLAKVRAQTITGRNSPSQSRNSPLPTPAAAETTAVAVLNLDAQTPNLGPEHIKSFEKYKTNREIRSIAENREKITDDFKKFRTQFDSRNGQLRRSSSNANSSGNTNIGTTAEKKAVEPTPKADPKASGDRSTQTKAEEVKAPQPTSSKATEATLKPKTKLKSKLDPNAAEFKLNPDAQPFEPAVQKQQVPVNPVPYPMSPYPGGQVPQEYVQNVQPGHQGYPVPMQAMGQIPYGQSYGMMVPAGAVPAGIPAGNSAYQFMQAPPGAFAGQQVPSRFAPSGGMPVSYGYPQMNPNMPMVVGQGPQGIPAGPYPYYAPGPYPGGQVPGGPQMSQPPQHMYSSNQHGVAQMQGGPMYQGGRGGQGHRRGGFGRKGGKHHGQHSHNAAANAAVNSSEKVMGRPLENGMANDASQR
ncbi:unnamed protein product [Chondrus crispus]|uniref:LsmAD domain-containing protein n=1 Tax=Chondrus crispus TaxID=2769 RepID=R7Q4N7_CHOCR|nr:unnamed protein product [Chondrus crispus]CDF32838.1 unnamed protein product [Chondrus crispus]|eukprot:XP_005712639.1 unnamed protein product [Chondrus crispus]